MRALCVVLLVAACDSKATPTDTGGVKAETKSKEYESCGASMHCQDDLRCVEHSCRRTARSNIGDYYAANGARLRAVGDLEGAIASYASALANYDAAKLGLPPDVDCAYGTTLAAARGKKEHAELAARVLHRCINAVPASSSLRETALVQLANLTDNGLDPTLLGPPKLADLYLTKGAAAPATDKLTVSVTGSPTPTAKSWPKITDKLGGPDVKPALIACWQTFNAATKKDQMTVSIGLKVGFAGNPDYEEEGAWFTKLEAPAGSVGPEDGCVRAAIEAPLKSLKLAESIGTTLAITVK